MCFKKLFFKNKDILIYNLRSIEPIRNQVAHNRKVSESFVNIVLSVFEILISSLGEDRVVRLVNKCTNVCSLFDYFKNLRNEIIICSDLVNNAESIPQCKCWDYVKNEWWFDNEYLEIELESLRYFFDKLILTPR